MAQRIPLNVIFTIPFNRQQTQDGTAHQPNCQYSVHHYSHQDSHHDSHFGPCLENASRQYSPLPYIVLQDSLQHPSHVQPDVHGHHGNSYHHTRAHHAPDVGHNGWRPSGRPLLLAMSLDSTTLAVADSLHTISIFSVVSRDEKLKLIHVCQKPSSQITALAITEGGHTVLFVEKSAPAVLKTFHVSNPAKIHEVSPVHETEHARVISCSISSHFILASFYSDRSSTGTMALWQRKRNRIDSELTHVFSWPSLRNSRNTFYTPVYVTEWHSRGDHSKYYAEVAYHVDNKLVLHPEVGNEACEPPSVLSLATNPISIRIDQSHGRDCVYILTEEQLRIYRVKHGKLCLSDSVLLDDGVSSSAVCGIWKGNRNRHVTVARIVNDQVVVFRAQLPNTVRFHLP